MSTYRQFLVENGDTLKQLPCSQLTASDNRATFAAHAVSTYRQFLIENGDTLKQLPAPKIAIEYYKNDDPYLFNMDSALVRGASNEAPRAPPCDTLYDVFVNILEDEWVRALLVQACPFARAAVRHALRRLCEHSGRRVGACPARAGLRHAVCLRLLHAGSWVCSLLR